MVEMTKYEWRSDTTKLLRMLRNSKTLKEKYGWSRQVSAGFIAEDISDVVLNPDKTISVVTEAFNLTQKPAEYNLRETKELIRWLEQKQWREQKPVEKGK